MGTLSHIMNVHDCTMSRTSIIQRVDLGAFSEPKNVENNIFLTKKHPLKTLKIVFFHEKTPFFFRPLAEKSADNKGGIVTKGGGGIVTWNTGGIILKPPPSRKKSQNFFQGVLIFSKILQMFEKGS